MSAIKQRSDERESILAETAIVRDMAGRVLRNGGEPAYTTEKLWRAFVATARALVRDLHLDPQELVDAIEQERQR